MTLLKTQAIQNALLGDWNRAISLNRELLKNNPNDTEALNRLAFAYSILGKIKDAKETYHKVLAIDTLNSIALRGLKRLASSLPHKPVYAQDDSIQKYKAFTGNAKNIFLEETGKTKIIELINTAEPKNISKLNTGEFLILSIKRLKIFVLDSEKQFIGMLPDNIGKRLIKFLKGGNTYEAYVRSVVYNHVTIFIKETKRATRFKNQPSFVVTDRSYLHFGKNVNLQASKHYPPDADEEESF